jgi:phosphohistidine phosphatase SixA
LALHRDIEGLIIVGHQPQLNRLVSLLLGAALMIGFRKSAPR